MLVLVLIFVVGNAILWMVYRERTYPRTKVMGVSIGSVNYAQLAQKVDERKLLPASLQLSYDDQTIETTLDELGIKKDLHRTAHSADSQRSWLPILNIVRSSELKAPVGIDEGQFNTKASEIATALRKDPVNARLALNGTTVDIQPGVNGFELDQKALQQSVIASLDAGKSKMSAPATPTVPSITADSLKESQTTLQNQLKTSITYRYNSQAKQASSEDIAKWFVQSGETYVLAAAPIQAYIMQVGKQFGIRVKNIESVATSTRQAVSAQKALDITLAVQTAAKTYTYCVAAKGVDVSYLPTLKSKLHATYGDARGWSLDGSIDYVEVAGTCNFTVWLTAASLMPTFGAICDSLWSCRVGDNVVINFDRWQHASPSWNASGGSLDDYRSMVINHETGHWLGFGHSSCSGPGQPAPVMQQQSIDLQGCTFNPWPTAGETSSLKRKLGL